MQPTPAVRVHACIATTRANCPLAASVLRRKRKSPLEWAGQDWRVSQPSNDIDAGFMPAGELIPRVSKHDETRMPAGPGDRTIALALVFSSPLMSRRWSFGKSRLSSFWQYSTHTHAPTMSSVSAKPTEPSTVDPLSRSIPSPSHDLHTRQSYHIHGTCVACSHQKASKGPNTRTSSSLPVRPVIHGRIHPRASPPHVQPW